MATLGETKEQRSQDEFCSICLDERTRNEEEPRVLVVLPQRTSGKKGKYIEVKACPICDGDVVNLSTR